MKTVMIKEDQGAFSVGEMPEMGGEDAGMKGGMGGGGMGMMGKGGAGMKGADGGMGMMGMGGGKDMGEEGGMQEGANMQPVASLDEALDKARELLSVGKPDQNEMWNRVQRDRALEQQPGGPMMGMK